MVAVSGEAAVVAASWEAFLICYGLLVDLDRVAMVPLKEGLENIFLSDVGVLI